MVAAAAAWWVGCQPLGRYLWVVTHTLLGDLGNPLLLLLHSVKDMGESSGHLQQ